MTNGRTYDSYTGDVKQKDKRYFIQLLYALDNNLITEKKIKKNMCGGFFFLKFSNTKVNSEN